MSQLKLTTMTESESAPSSIRIYRREDMVKIATVWDDDTITFNPEVDYDTKVLKQIRQIQKNYYTLFNSLTEKDEEIRQLKLLSLNPVIEKK